MEHKKAQSQHLLFPFFFLAEIKMKGMYIYIYISENHLRGNYTYPTYHPYPIGSQKRPTLMQRTYSLRALSLFSNKSSTGISDLDADPADKVLAAP